MIHWVKIKQKSSSYHNTLRSFKKSWAESAQSDFYRSSTSCAFFLIYLI